MKPHFVPKLSASHSLVSDLKPSTLRSERLRAVIKKAVATCSHHCFSLSIIWFVASCMSRVKMNVLRTPLTYSTHQQPYKLYPLSLLGVSTSIEGIARLMFDCTALAVEIWLLIDLCSNATRS